MNIDNHSFVERAIVRLCAVVLWVTTSVTFLILTANTVLRYTMGASLQWANELPELLFPWLVMAGVVMAAVHGSHIATTFLMASIPARAGRVVAVVGWLSVTGLYSTLAYTTFQMLEIVHDEKSPILQVPGSVTYGCMAGAMALLAMLALQSAWRAVTAPEWPLPSTDASARPQTAQG